MSLLTEKIIPTNAQPVTLETETRVISLCEDEFMTDVNERLWQHAGKGSTLPAGLFNRLSDMDKALAGLAGIRAILRGNSNCLRDAEDSDEFEYTPLNLNVVSNLEDGMDVLVDMLRTTMEKMRNSDWSQTSGAIKFPNY